MSPPTSATTTPVPAGDQGTSTQVRDPALNQFSINLAEWVRETQSAVPVRPRTPTEEERREQELYVQALIEEMDWEEEQAENERAAAVARFHAEEAAPKTQEEMRAWIQNATRIFSRSARRHAFER